MVELLVVIAIISILAAMLLPSLNNVRKKACRASCMNNLKQLGVGFGMYLQDYDDWFPGWWDIDPNNNTYRWYGKILDELEINYSSDVYDANMPKILDCPSDPIAKDTSQHWVNRVSYGYNIYYLDYEFLSWGGCWGEGSKYNRIKNPNQIICVSDCKDFAPGVGENRARISQHEDDHSPSDIHDGGSNCLFTDWHVEWKLRSELLYIRESTGQGNNKYFGY